MSLDSDKQLERVIAEQADQRLEQVRSAGRQSRTLEIVEDIRTELGGIQSDLRDRYVSKEQFTPVQKLVYGLVAATLLSVIGALSALVFGGSTP